MEGCQPVKKLLSLHQCVVKYESMYRQESLAKICSDIDMHWTQLATFMNDFAINHTCSAYIGNHGDKN